MWEYTGPWGISNGSRLKSFMLQLMDSSSESWTAGSVRDTDFYRVDPESGVATIRVRGILLNAIPKWLRSDPGSFTSYADIGQAVRAAAADPDVREILLLVDSPGGQIAGLYEALTPLWEVRKVKTLSAHVIYEATAAAYWLTSQAATISAGANSLIGGIGLFTVYQDLSKYYESKGVKVHVVRSGEHKGMGLDAITEKQIAAVQAIIDGLTQNFIGDVARGRRRSKADISKLATGQVWIAEAARQRGLIDRVT